MSGLLVWRFVGSMLPADSLLEGGFHLQTRRPLAEFQHPQQSFDSF